MTDHPKRSRSTLPKPLARRQYVEAGELVVMEQIRTDAGQLDAHIMAVGPFARLDAGTAADRYAKTRGAITNLFGSQASYQAETMELALNAGRWLESIRFPNPSDFLNAEAWIDAFLAGQSARGPRHGSEPEISYAFVWTLWLSVVPYGMWSTQISRSSMEEHVQWVRRLEVLFESGLQHFGFKMRDGTTVNDLACGIASLIEGVWLNQCLTHDHPCDPPEPISTVLRRSGLMLWRGATEPGAQT